MGRVSDAARGQLACCSSRHSSRSYRYLRTAELYAETAGDAAAQQVVEQVRGALLNSADREQCYLIRARAYLQLANFDNAKRDLGAPHSLPAASPSLAHRRR